jgi:hypothetical protein
MDFQSCSPIKKFNPFEKPPQYPNIPPRQFLNFYFAFFYRTEKAPEISPLYGEFICSFFGFGL